MRPAAPSIRILTSAPDRQSNVASAGGRWPIPIGMIGVSLYPGSAKHRASANIQLAKKVIEQIAEESIVSVGRPSRGFHLVSPTTSTSMHLLARLPEHSNSPWSAIAYFSLVDIGAELTHLAQSASYEEWTVGVCREPLNLGGDAADFRGIDHLRQNVPTNVPVSLTRWAELDELLLLSIPTESMLRNLPTLESLALEFP